MSAVTSPAPADPSTLVEQILAEGPIGAAQAARVMGVYRDGKPTHPSTITRWARQGVRLADGRVVKLGAVRVNGRLATSRAALVRFVAEQNQDNAGDVSPAPRTPTARRSASEAAAGELAAAGI